MRILVFLCSMLSLNVFGVSFSGARSSFSSSRSISSPSSFTRSIPIKPTSLPPTPPKISVSSKITTSQKTQNLSPPPTRVFNTVQRQPSFNMLVQNNSNDFLYNLILWNVFILPSLDSNYTDEDKEVNNTDNF